MSTATITSKGQITIPKDVRSLCDLRAGDKVDFITHQDGSVSFIPIKKNLVTLKGIIDKPSKAVSIEEMNAVIKRRGSQH